MSVLRKAGHRLVLDTEFGNLVEVSPKVGLPPVFIDVTSDLEYETAFQQQRYPDEEYPS